MKITPITPTIGAEITGIDLEQPLSDHSWQAIARAFADHHVLVFRDQVLSRERHKAFARRFGEIHIHPSKKHAKTTQDPEFFLIDIKPDDKGSNGEVWHADITCEQQPPYASLLYITEVPKNGGGDTLFANMHDAFDELSPSMQAYLGGQQAFHDGEQDLRRYCIRLKPGQYYPAHAHPVVVVHPFTGRPVLYVNEAFTSHLLEMPLFESNLILNGLYDRIRSNPRLHCRVQWTPNMLTLWDNYSVQHQAVFDYQGYRRYGERITVSSPATPKAYSAAS